jgi:CheY-like chemotaxis protein
VGSERPALPAAAAAQAAAEIPAPACSVHPGETILVIDDEEMVRGVATAVLERHGFRVLSAENGKAGVAVLRRHRGKVALVVLDLLMPEMGGAEALERLREIRPDVPVLLSSGFDQSEAGRRFTGKKLAGFIQKPAMQIASWQQF